MLFVEVADEQPVFFYIYDLINLLIVKSLGFPKVNPAFFSYLQSRQIQIFFILFLSLLNVNSTIVCFCCRAYYIYAPLLVFHLFFFLLG